MTPIQSRKKLHVVIGLGKSGIGAAKLLRSYGDDVKIIENGERKSFLGKYNELKNMGIDIILTGSPLSLNNFSPWIENISSIIISPSIPWDDEVLRKLRSKNIPIRSEAGLAWQHLNNIPWIGITGTNGKTTVSHMLHHVLEFNKVKTDIGGNVGKSLSELAYNYKESNKEIADWLVVELSSYQIESSQSIRPEIGIWTTLTPDHLERHGTLQAYSNIKQSLLEKSSFRIYNSDDDYIFSQKKNLPKGFWISSKFSREFQDKPDLWINSKGFVVNQTETLFHSSSLDLPGNHNLQNLLLVTAAAMKIGLKADGISKALKTFKGVPHRLEKLVKFNNLKIFNDSKATNYESSSTGIHSVPHPAVLIAGGQKKKGSPDLWLQALEKYCSAIVLFGKSNEELHDIVRQSGFSGKIIIREKLEEALQSAIQIGVNSKAKSLLFSPACASFDQYKNFEDRGNHFIELVWKYHKNRFNTSLDRD